MVTWNGLVGSYKESTANISWLAGQMAQITQCTVFILTDTKIISCDRNENPYPSSLTSFFTTHRQHIEIVALIHQVHVVQAGCTLCMHAIKIGKTAALHSVHQKQIRKTSFIAYYIIMSNIFFNQFTFF
jgi:hypothetical protein